MMMGATALCGASPFSLFNPKAYTGNGSAQSIITNVANDLVWAKHRSGSAQNHWISDSSRAIGKAIFSDRSDAETDIGGAGITAFNTNGFSIGSGDGFNQNAVNHMAFSWKKKSGYLDIITYTGNGSARTIAHALSVVPSFILIKRRDSSADWAVYHSARGNAKDLVLNGSDVENPSSLWNTTTPTTSVFSLGTDARVNANGATYVAYIFANSSSSIFGSYAGSGTDLNLTLGFVPKLYIARCYDSALIGGIPSHWLMYYQVGAAMKRIYGDTDGNEQDVTGELDFTATGVRINGNNIANYSGFNFIYAAWG